MITQGSTPLQMVNETLPHLLVPVRVTPVQAPPVLVEAPHHPAPPHLKSL